MSRLTPEDKALFQAEMKDVRPLKADSKITMPPPPVPIPKKSLPLLKKAHDTSKRSAPKNLTTPADAPLYYSSTAPHFTADERIFFARPHVQMKQIRSLQRGQITPQAKLDLHGHTIDSAEQALRRFLLNAEQMQYRAVQIISGKGGEKALLKNHLCQWLKQLPMVLAYASSPSARGGAGAVDVLLKRKKHNNRSDQNQGR